MTKRVRRQGSMTFMVALAAALCAAQEPVVVRLRDVVGDTVDLAERDSFGLFPNTARFQQAVILALPGPEFYAEITRPRADSTVRIFLRIMPTDLERIRFLIDNHGDVAARERSDSSYARALAAFWHTIEDQPLRNMAGEPAVEQEVVPPTTELAPPSERTAPEEAVPTPTEAESPTEPATAEGIPPAPPDEATAGKPLDTMPAIRPQLHPASTENRYNYTLHGAALGSVAGACLVSDAFTGSYGAGPSVSAVAAFGATALGTYMGYRHGDRLDRNSAAAQPLRGESMTWRTGCAACALAPGVVLGALATALVVEVADHRGEAWIPAVLSGLCVTVEVVAIGYRYGRDIDRNRALEAEVERRARGR